MAKDIRTTAMLLSLMAGSLKFGSVRWPLSIQNLVKILQIVLNLKHVV